MAYLLDLTFLDRYMVRSNFVSETLEWRKNFDNVNNAVRINCDIAPKEAILLAKRKNIPSFFMLPGCKGCDSIFHDCVEKLEPNSHQFCPVEMIKYGGEKKYEGKYYILNILKAVDFINIKESEKNKSVFWDEKHSVWIQNFSYSENLIIDPQKCYGIHLWRWSGISKQSLFASDQLVDRLKENKATGLVYHKLSEY